jgi:hypothetical protein
MLKPFLTLVNGRGINCGDIMERLNVLASPKLNTNKYNPCI